MDSTIFRPADFIEMVINNLALALLLGFIFIALVLAAFFFEWRTVLISLIVIPVSFVAAGLVLSLTGVTINMIVMTGFLIAIGVVVEDAIIDVENIVRRLRQAREANSPKPTLSIILEASFEMRSAVTYALLILLLAVTPIFFLEGASRTFFQPLAISYGLALLASMLVALTVTPALCLLLLAGVPVERRVSPLVMRLQQVYETGLTRIMQRGGLAFIVVGILTVAGLVALPFLRQSLLPSFKERNLVIHLNGAPGISQTEMSRISGRVSQELKSIPGVKNVGAHIGRAVMSDQVVNVSSAGIWVSIDPAADYDKTAAAIQNVVDGYPGLYHDVETYLKEKSSEVVAEPNDSLTVRVYGDADNALRGAAENVKKAITGIKGVVDSQIKFPAQQPTLEIEVDLAAAQRYGIKPGDVRRAAATMFSGLQVGNLFEEQKVFDVVVWSLPETRNSLTSMRDLMIDTPDGGHVRLGDVAQVRVVSTPSVIRHEAVKRYFDIVVDVQGRDLGAVAADIKSSLQNVQFPLEYHAEVLGGYAEQQGALTRLFTFALAAVLGIFLLLQAAFGSWRLALVAILTLPMALAGGVLAMFLGGGVISLGSLAGFLTVLGIVIRNGLVMTSHFHHLERDEGQTFGPELVLRGARERLAPILTTAFATGLALVPALFLGDIPGLEVIRPMAIVILGGLVTSMLLDLYILPALYLRYGASREPDLELQPITGVELPVGAQD
jgi:Cu/Ag efflux pump CusA